MEAEVRSILQLDIAGQPSDWITPEDAARQYASGAVAWTLGDVVRTMVGGRNRQTGIESRIDLHPIIAIRGPVLPPQVLATPIALTNEALFRRGRHTCGVCAALLTRLEAEHGGGEPRSVSGASNNPIGALQELAQKRRFAPPVYVFETLQSAPPSFRATVTVAGPVAAEYHADASTKQAAKHHAAELALAAASQST